MARRPCARFGCPNIVDRGYCASCRKAAPARIYERSRGGSAERMYGYAWQRASKAWLREHPWCADLYGTHGERFELAKLVDHIVPHKGNRELFWDQSNWQSLCVACHGRKTAMEDGGFGRVASSSGVPNGTSV
jgi:5-methylcytosine-specific restriction enzyme A